MAFSTPPNTRIYAIGDLSQSPESLACLIDFIHQDAANFNGRKILVTLGGIFTPNLETVDTEKNIISFKKSHAPEILTILRTINLPGFEVIHLRGISEVLLQEAIDVLRLQPDKYRPRIFNLIPILNAYGRGTRVSTFSNTINPKETVFYPRLRKQLLRVMPAEDIAFLRHGFKDTFVCGRFLFHNQLADVKGLNILEPATLDGNEPYTLRFLRALSKSMHTLKAQFSQASSGACLVHVNSEQVSHDEGRLPRFHANGGAVSILVNGEAPGPAAVCFEGETQRGILVHTNRDYVVSRRGGPPENRIMFGWLAPSQPQIKTSMGGRRYFCRTGYLKPLEAMAVG